MLIDRVETSDVIRALKPIWSEKPETASRLRQRIEAVIDYASAPGLRVGDNPARWRGQMDHLLPRPKKARAVVHDPALPRAGVAARALRCTVLTTARSGETRGMTWAEVDPDARLWTIPAARMKACKEHHVPLSAPALALLGPRWPCDALVFESEAKPGKAISDMSMTAVLRRMGHHEITVHGFRPTFRDWAGETTGFPREVIEAALAPGIKDKAEAAYARSDLFNKRRGLMDAWAHAATLQRFGPNVVAFS